MLNPGLEPPPMLVCKYVDGSVTMLAIKKLAGVTQEVNLRNLLHQVMKHVNEGIPSTLALNPRVDVTKSGKQEYQWPHKKD